MISAPTELARRNPMDNRAIVRHLYEEVWNKRRFELLDELISPSHAIHDSNSSGSSVGPEAYKAQITRYMAAFPDLRFTIEDIVGENEKIVVDWTISGTHRGEMWGFRPTNKKMSLEGITIHHIANGKIIDSFVKSDALQLLKQLRGTVSHYLTLEKLGGGGMGV